MSPADAAALLGVPLGADRTTVARAFRDRARAVHPDVAGGPGDEFIRLAQARDALLAHQPETQRLSRARMAAAPPFSRRLFATWIALLAFACLLGASGAARPLAPVEPIVRSLVLLSGFGGYALTGRRPWLVAGLLGLAGTVVVAVAATSLGALLGLLLSIPAMYGLALQGVRRGR